ncbi:MAG: alpha/beta hydrolase [Hyphomicrobiaceae bacterium]
MQVQDQTYKIKGGRVGVLLIHGLCGTPTEMRFVAHGLARQGYTVHCPMLAGHGGTEDDIKVSTWQDWMQSAEDALMELRKDCDTVIVGGLSTGAILSLMLAAKYPDDVQATALFAPTLWLNGWLIPWYARLFKTVFHKRVANMINFPDMHPHGIKDPRIREFIANALSSGDSSVAGTPNTPGGAVLEHRWLVKALKRQVQKITQPTLILHPREDDYADLNNALYLQRNLRGIVELTVLDDSYHIVTVDRQRHLVVDRTVAFVDRLVKQLSANKGAKTANLRASSATEQSVASAA